LQIATYDCIFFEPDTSVMMEKIEILGPRLLCKLEKYTLKLKPKTFG
jgi:hypothetical protein